MPERGKSAAALPAVAAVARLWRFNRAPLRRCWISSRAGIAAARILSPSSAGRRFIHREPPRGHPRDRILKATTRSQSRGASTYNDLASVSLASTPGESGLRPPTTLQRKAEVSAGARRHHLAPLSFFFFSFPHSLEVASAGSHKCHERAERRLGTLRRTRRQRRLTASVTSRLCKRTFRNWPVRKLEGTAP